MSRRTFLAAVGLFSVLSVVLCLAAGAGDALAESMSTIGLDKETADVPARQNSPPQFPSRLTTTRSIPENTPSGWDIGDPVTPPGATSGANLTYTLGGEDAAAFDISSNSGQLLTNYWLDYETQNSYSVTVTETGQSSTATTIHVTITVTDVNEPPDFEDSRIRRSVAENAPARSVVGDPVTATDPEGDKLFYALVPGHGNDDMFTVDSSTGQLRTKAPLDYEKGPIEYWVRIAVRDGKGPGGERDLVADNDIMVDITVTNEDEPGTVTLNWRGPRVGTNLTATLEDPDGGVTDETWQWARSDSRNGTFTNINNTENTYTAVTGDEGKYLRVTVTYTDKQGPNKSAEFVFAHQVAAGGVSGSAAPSFPEGNPTTRSVAENTPPGVNIGSPVSATGGSELRYTLEGEDADRFAIVATSGQLQTKAALDYEGKSSYSVRVTATNKNNQSDSIDVTINVTDEPVEIHGPSRIDFSEGEYIYSPVVTQYTIEPSSAELTLTGPDARHFSIASWGPLTFKTQPDYEAPADSGRNNVYDITINATHETGGTTHTARHNVRVTVIDDNEPPVVTGPDQITYPEGGTGPVAAYRATDPERDPIRWYVQDTDDFACFRTTQSGVLFFKEPPDYENPCHGRQPDSIYEVVLVAMSGMNRGGDGIRVSVTVTDGNDAPVIGRRSSQIQRVYENILREVAENTAAGTDIGDPVTATDPDRDTLTYSLGGRDRASFAIDSSTGQLQTKAALDYEAKNSYTVTVTANDGRGGTDTTTVTINVTNVDEDGVVGLSSGRARARSSLTATLSDPDGGVTGESWQWAKSTTQNGGYQDISGATLNTYTPEDADVGKFLRARVEYADTFGTSKSAQRDSTNTVRDGPNRPPVFPDQDSNTAGNQRVRTLAVAENTAANTNIGGPVLATDADGDTLAYYLGGTNAASFAIDSSTGQLQTKAALDYETKNRYSVTVRANDGTGESNANATIAVTINVTNAEEAGTVTLSPSSPRTGASLTATLSDPDGGLTSVTWKWEGSSDKSTWTTISSITSASYTPVAGDVGNYLRSTASYTDGHGSGKTARGVSDDAVRVNNAPDFGANTANRSLAENTPASQNIGTAFAATDADGDTLTYSLGGTDAASFAIDPSTGQLRTNAALDYEAKNSYTLMVRADDPYNASDTITVNIRVTDVDEDGEIAFSPAQPQAHTGLVATLADDDVVQSIQSWQWEISGSNNAWTTIGGATTGTYVPLDGDVGKYLRVTVTYTDGHGSGKRATATTADMVEDKDEGPAFSTGTAQRSIAENAAVNTNIGSPVTATGSAARGSLTYTLDGTDAASFAIVATSGQLQTRAALDYEVKNSYTVTVKAADPLLDSDTITVTITVTDVEEPGAVSFDSTTPTMRTALNASLSDPDGSVTGKTWQWASAATATGSFGDISGATSATYTPVAGDAGKYLRATVTYADGHGSSKTAQAVSANRVRVNTVPDFGSGTAARSVFENAPAGRNIGAPVTASDPDAGESLTYSLGGADAASFAVVATSGQLQTRAALDYETRSSYTVTVAVTDRSNASDSITVNIQVADVDEAGTVALSSAWPRAGAALTASLSDPDAPVTAMSWQWAWSNSGNGSYNNISGATSASYTPVAGDAGKYLRAAVVYTDKHGSGKRAQKASGNPVVQARVNTTPAFGPGPAARSIPENTPAGRNIGAPVTASDPDPGDSLSYTLGGTDAASFAIVATSGQLRTRAALDYETRNSYTVTVAVTDQFGASGTITVNITVTDVRPPGKPGTPTVAAASVGGHNTLLVAWAAPPGAGTAISGYNVQYRARVSGSWSGNPRSVSGTAATVSGLVPSTAYQVRVRAYNSEGNSDWSNIGQGRTDAAPIQQQRLLPQGSGRGVQSPVCTPSIGFRTGIPFSFTAARGGGDPPEVLLEVWDRELCGMNFRVSSGAKWLSLSPASGRSEGAHQQRLIRISADISGLGVGTHTAAIRITAPGSSNSPQTVSVSLTITEPAPPESNHCQEHTVIESSDGALRVVVPPGSAPCDMGITVESLDADFRKTLEGRSVDVVRVGKVSAETADSGIDAGLWALLPGDRVSACEKAAAAVYRVDGESWEPLTHRCEMDEQGRAWTVSPLTGFGVYAVTLPAPSAESGIVSEVQLQPPEAAGINVSLSTRTPSPTMMTSNEPASSMKAVEPQHTPAPRLDIVYADDSTAGLWADLPPEELAPSVEETGHSPPRRLGRLGILLYMVAPVIVIIALLLIMFGVRSLRGAESASP